MDATGKVTLTIEAGEIKIHSNFDDRNVATLETLNKAEFSNILSEMVKVYGRFDRTKISYKYDSQHQPFVK